MDDFHRYIWFNTLDHTGTPTTSGYTLPITPFTFIPIFDDGSSDKFSKQKILWDFGDGTTSESITAVHNFKYPGWYNVKCYVLGPNGVGYENSFSQSILVKDLISDTLVLSGFNNKTESGTIQNPYEIYRYNSWQTYSMLSATGYTINLSVSGNTAPILQVEQYEKDKWGHLKPSSRFETFIINPLTQKEERFPVNYLTTSNYEIYVKLNRNNQIVLCAKDDFGACFAGTSGSKVFYYIDDIPKLVDSAYESVAATIFATFDTTKFKDFDSFNREYPVNSFNILNDISNSNSFSVIIEKLHPSFLTITSNGIDDDNDGNRIHTFDIYPEKYVNQKIPFVVRIKDRNECGGITNSKYSKVLSATNNPDPGPYEVYLELKDSRNNKINNVNFYSNFGILSSEIYGGYFKGYLTYDSQIENVHIYAKANLDLTEIYTIDTTYSVLGEPQSDNIHSIRVRRDTNDPKKKIIDDKIYNFPGLSGIYSSCVTYRRNCDGSVISYIWVVDADREKISKYNAETMTLVYDRFELPENSSPSNITSDQYCNVWVTLYDSVCSVRINDITNLVDMVIVPSLSNRVIDYENTVTPASIDTDRKNNIWISYSNQLSSFIEKYDTVGNVLSTIILSPSYESTEIVTDLKYNVWGILKDLSTATKELSAKNDKVVKITDSGVMTYYPISGSLWNITLDAQGNIWTTRNRNEVVKINSTTNLVSTFALDTFSEDSPNNYVSDLEGIACTTDNTILVVDNFNKALHYFNANTETNGFSASKLNLINVGITDPMRISDKVNGYGDWNGFRHINKYRHVIKEESVVTGISNDFSIFYSNSGKYDIRKVNENFDPTEQIKAYRFQDYLLDTTSVFDFIGAAVGTLSSRPTEMGKLIYEKISNFTDNVINIDTCNVNALKSMYEMMDEIFYTFNGSNIGSPAELTRLIDLFSITYTKLKGSRDLFNQNFNDRGYHNDQIRANGGVVLYGINKGAELNFLTSVLTAGNDIVAYEKFSETYTLIDTDLLSTAYINFIDPVNKTYALSSYHPNWGWGLVLPDNYIKENVERYYLFYEYVRDFAYNQTEGLINWADKYTTISENLTSVEQWNIIRENMISYALAKGTGVVK